MLLVLPAAYLVLALSSGLPAVPDRGPGSPLHGTGLALVQLRGRTAGSEPEGGFCVPPPGAALVQAFVSWPKQPEAPAFTGLVSAWGPRRHQGAALRVGPPPSPGGCSPRGQQGLRTALVLRSGLGSFTAAAVSPPPLVRKLWSWAT